MRVRIVRMFCQAKCRDVLVIQQWFTRENINEWRRTNQRIGADPLPQLDEHWEGIKDFELDEYDKATAFAMDLSMEKKTPTELAVFEDGICEKSATSVDSAQTQ